MEKQKHHSRLSPRDIHDVPIAKYMGLSGPSLRTAIGLTAGLCFISFGYGQGDVGGLLLVPSFREMFPRIDTVGQYPNADVAIRAGIVVATWNIGCFVASIMTFVLGDRFGRKDVMIVGLICLLAGKIVQSSSFGLAQYIVGRFVAGMGNGFIASTVPAWQAECLKTHRRGTLLLVSFGSCITGGLAIAYWIAYGMSFAEPNSASWRFTIAFVIVFILAALAMVFSLPESPRWLILTGRETEAKRVLSALNELPPEDEDVRREFLMIKNTLLHMSSGSLARTFSQGDYRYVHRVILAVCLQIMQQWTGVNLFMQWLGVMFKTQLLYSTRLSLLLASCCATEFFLASIIAVIGIDRFWGRRSMSMFGASGMCLCMIILAICEGIGTTKARYAMTAFLFLYNTFFSFGWQGMSWLWAVELTPLQVRGPGNALSTAANWLSNFVVVLVAPILFAEQGYKTYIVFAATNFAIVPAIYLFYPETGYRSLEEVDVLFSEATKLGHPAFSVVKAAKDTPLWWDKNGEKSDSYASETGGSSGMEKGGSSDPAHSQSISPSRSRQTEAELL